MNSKKKKRCKHWNYPDAGKLPTASVVIVFVNEGWSTLMRTVHSVINTSPPALLKEIILVDDGSTKEDLKQKLSAYIVRFQGQVKLKRLPRTMGLIRARVSGAESAAGDVIVILDAHCECAPNWLPPLLTRIAVNRKILAVPIVDSIDWNTLKHEPYFEDIRSAGIFEWGFLYKEMRISDVDFAKKKYKTEPNQ